MNEQKIQELLLKYFDGATSLDEERDLQRYFAQGDMPDSLKTYRPLFDFFAEERDVQPPAQKPEARRIRMNLSIITGIAASIAILFMVGMPKMKTDDYVYYVNGQRVYDQTAAMELAENKLQLLAVSMQKANSSMAAIDKLHESSQSLQQLSKISEAYRRIELGIRN